MKEESRIALIAKIDYTIWFIMKNWLDMVFHNCFRYQLIDLKRHLFVEQIIFDHLTYLTSDFMVHYSKIAFVRGEQLT